MIYVFIFKLFTALQEHVFSDKVEKILNIVPRKARLSKKQKKKKAKAEPSIRSEKAAAPAATHAMLASRKSVTPMDIDEDDDCRRIVGIRNSGNDCWLSAPAQAIFWSVGAAFLTSLEAVDNFTIELVKLFERLNDATVGSTDVVAVREEYWRQYGNDGEEETSQQDAREFFRNTLLSFPELAGTFQFELYSKAICKVCGRERPPTSAVETALRPGIDPSKTLDLESIIAKELEGDSRTQLCENCEKKQTHQVQTSIRNVSSLFAIELRPPPDATYTVKVAQDAVICLRPYGAENDFSLSTVVTYSRSGNDGHFIAYGTATSELRSTTQLNDALVESGKWYTEDKGQRPVLLIFKAIAMAQDRRDDIEERQSTLSRDEIDARVAVELIEPIVNGEFFDQAAKLLVTFRYEESWAKDRSIFNAGRFFNKAEVLLEACIEQRRLTRNEENVLLNRTPTKARDEAGDMEIEDMDAEDADEEEMEADDM